jgi:hypothetical protein
MVVAVLREVGITAPSEADVDKARGALMEARRSLVTARACRRPSVLSVFRDDEDTTAPVSASALVGIASRMLASRVPSEMGFSEDGPPSAALTQMHTRATKRGVPAPPCV